MTAGSAGPPGGSASPSGARKGRAAWIFGGSILAIAALAAFVASASPDGLERVAGDLGFEGHAVTHYEAPVPDYALPQVGGPLSGSLAGVLGTVVVGVVAWGAGRLVRVRRPA